MKESPIKKIKQAFRPRARVLQLLGDELIASPRLAVFELVKNAYDADASEVRIQINLDEPGGAMIVVADDGEGMTLSTLKNVWLVPGDDHRQRQRNAAKRSPKYNRLPLGEKGLGRFAVHKLGNRIKLITRARRARECVVDIDWEKLIERPYLDRAPISISVLPRAEAFARGNTGTRIEVRQLRMASWSRGEVRRLHNQITSICSPFVETSGFRAVLAVTGYEHWISDLPDPEEIIRRAIWKYSFRLSGSRFDSTYEFMEIPAFRLNSRTVEKQDTHLALPPFPSGKKKGETILADDSTTAGIGDVAGEFHVFDRDQEVRRRLAQMRLVGSFLDENGGVRVYRDGIRVYNYGEKGDDWLGLDLRRVNAPTRRLSRNIVLGSIHLSLEGSGELVEKTNREGFVENDAYERLRTIVLGALSAFEAERQIDKDRIRRFLKQPDESTVGKIEKPIAELRRALRERGILETLDPFLKQIEREYRNMQSTLLSAGMSGLNLAVVFHEVERGVRVLHRVIAEDGDPESALLQAKELSRLLDGFTSLLRKDTKKTQGVRGLVLSARQFNVLRFRHHGVELVCPIQDEQESDEFRSNFAFNLVLGALNNLIDNALYWLRIRWPEEDNRREPLNRKLFIGTSRELALGPAIVVADNGTGFQGDDPENLVRPFFTRKPAGMGLGLYYASLAMELNGGQILLPASGEVDIPEEFDGAVVAMVFKEVE